MVSNSTSLVLVNSEVDVQVSFTIAMAQNPKRPGRFSPILRAVIEVSFVVFLFYSNLLMGEFNASNGTGKTLSFALNDIFTAMNLLIAIGSALTGYVIFEFLRKRL